MTLLPTVAYAYQISRGGLTHQVAGACIPHFLGNDMTGNAFTGEVLDSGGHLPCRLGQGCTCAGEGVCDTMPHRVFIGIQVKNTGSGVVLVIAFGFFLSCDVIPENRHFLFKRSKQIFFLVVGLECCQLIGKAVLIHEVAHL